MDAFNSYISLAITFTPFIIASIIFHLTLRKGVISVSYHYIFGDLDFGEKFKGFSLIAVVFILFSFSLQNTLEILYGKLTEEVREVIYLGDKSPARNYFAEVNQPEHSFSVKTFAIAATTFKSVYRSTSFVTLPGFKGKGVPSYLATWDSFSESLLTTLILFPFYFIAMLAYARPAEGKVPKRGTNADNNNSTAETKNSEGKQIKYTKEEDAEYRLFLRVIGGYAVVVVLLIIQQLIFDDPKATLGAQMIPLPESIKKNALLQAQPTYTYNITKALSRSTGTGSDRKTEYYEVATGYDAVYFKFEENFPIPVYLKTTYKVKDHPGRREKIKKHIKDQENLSVLVVDNLQIMILDIPSADAGTDN